MAENLVLEIAPQEVLRLMGEGGRVVLIDCREPQEHAIGSIEGAHLIPMNTVPARLQMLEAAADEARLIVFCHHGMRSLSVVNWLRQQGIENCQSLSGGIDQWSVEIDPKVPRY